MEDNSDDDEQDIIDDADDSKEYSNDMDEPPNKKQRQIKQRGNNNGKNNSNGTQHDMLHKLNIGQCGKFKFIRMPPFLVECAVQSGADMKQFAELLLKNENTYIGTPEEVIHPCKEHLKRQLSTSKISEDVRKVINSMLQSGDEHSAAKVLQITLSKK